MSGRALVVGVTGHQRRQRRATPPRRRLAGLGLEPPPAGSRRADHAAGRRPRGRRGGRRGRARHRSDARLLHDLVAPRDRGRELRRERSDAPEPPRRDRRREVRPPRRARDRAQALPRAVRGVRQGSAGHAVLRGSGPPAVRELLLRAGGHPLRRRRARRIHVVGAPAAHADRLGARERDEHGGDARRVRGDLPRDGARVPLPGLARAVGGGHRRDRRRPARRPSRLGGDDAGRREPGPQHRQRRRLPLAANVAAARCRARRRAGSVRRRRPRRSSSRWPTRPRSGPRSCAVTACAT